MKYKDILNLDENKDYDFCSICKVHEEAYNKIENQYVCKCGTVLYDLNENEDWTVVGEANYYDKEHEINKYIVLECYECGKRYALIPTEVIYNANHDIYYTGGKNYLIEDISEERIKKGIMKNIEQYTKRIKAGENLDSWNLYTWISYELEHIIAEYLYEKGFKK
jgi:hypothetical protein